MVKGGKVFVPIMGPHCMVRALRLLPEDQPVRDHEMLSSNAAVATIISTPDRCKKLTDELQLPLDKLSSEEGKRPSVNMLMYL